MTEPITPPPELVEQWRTEWCHTDESGSFDVYVATRAAQWGADQELKACCSVLENQLCCFVTEDLRTARRPKPPSLAEEALGAQQHLWDGGATHDDWHLIRRALERLQQLEDQQ